jgi:ATP-dependent exoDNAse (exonuclease V) beta subunit
MNWGASKGIDSFEDVCVVLNKTAQKLLENRKLIELNPKTKNKLYVACTRAHRHLYIVSYKFLEKYKKV